MAAAVLYISRALKGSHMANVLLCCPFSHLTMQRVGQGDPGKVMNTHTHGHQQRQRNNPPPQAPYRSAAVIRASSLLTSPNLCLFSETFPRSASPLLSRAKNPATTPFPLPVIPRALLTFALLRRH